MAENDSPKKKLESLSFQGEKSGRFATGWDAEETSPYPIDQESGRFAMHNFPIGMLTQRHFGCRRHEKRFAEAKRSFFV
ncbi:MAG: hypothetical protein F6K40_02355 [Okeania sp. SIO3I5]|uniref:hypothetical protein n=1 Tax=Okeania sp. SIO3I5 TaxID=2607805 RepID=UPI0013B5E668|nr:hypothetical protein [Okeania sp. SIO3I5]NEQ35211.1 hypothetical protein [Okeania sp. SIO3I5]